MILMLTGKVSGMGRIIMGLKQLHYDNMSKGIKNDFRKILCLDSQR